MDGRRIMSDDWAEKVADILGEERAWVTLCLAVERVKKDDLSDEMRRLLLAIPHRTAGFVAVVLAVFSVFSGQPVFA